MVVVMVRVHLPKLIMMELLKKIMIDRLLETAIQCIKVTEREEGMVQVAINFQKPLIQVAYRVKLIGFAGLSGY